MGNPETTITIPQISSILVENAATPGRFFVLFDNGSFKHAVYPWKKGREWNETMAEFVGVVQSFTDAQRAYREHPTEENTERFYDARANLPIFFKQVKPGRI